MGRRPAARFGLLALSIGAVLSSSAVAAGEDATGREEFDKLEQIIVTARKTGERLQDVPISITAMTGDQLRDRGAVDVKDILRSVPGLSFSGVERGLGNYNIRGISTDSSSPTVGVYLDDISLVTIASGFSGAFDAVFFDMERIEVLKGPQGTLYGGSSMGGAIKYVSARPDPSTQSFSTAAGVGTTKHGSPSYNAEGVINLPLVSDVLAVRGGVSYRKEGGFIDNVANGDIENSAFSSTPSPIYTPRTQPSLSTWDEDDYNSAETYVGRLSLLWEPDASWSIRPAVVYQDYRSDNASQFFTNQEELSASYRIPQPTEDRAGVYSLDVAKELGRVQMTSLTGYFDRKVGWHRDYSFFVGGLVPPLFPYTTTNSSNSRTKVFSQEFRVSSVDTQSGALRWVAGLYYSHQDDRLAQRARIIDGETSLFGTELAFRSNIDSKVAQYAAFGEATYEIAKNLDLTAGLRLFRVENTLNNDSGGPFNGGPTVIRDRRSEEDGANPKVGLSYKIHDDALVYASAAKGFRPGGTARFLVPANLCADDLERLGYSEPLEEYDSDNLWSYELGSKNQYNGGSAVLNGAIFYTDWKKIQQVIALPNCGFNFNDNAGEAVVKGVELEGQIYVTQSLQVGANATYTDTEIVDAADGTAARDGDQIQSVPEWMASAFGSYSMQLSSSWDLQLRADYQYRSKARRTFVRAQQVSFSDGVSGPVPFAAEFQEGYEVVDASASFSNGPTSIRLYLNNALDEQPYLDTDLSFGSTRTTTLRPRTIGVEVRRDF